MHESKVHGGRVVRCRTCDREVAGSNPALGCCVPTPTQRAIPLGSVNDYQRKLGSKRAYHAMHWPRIRGPAASAGVRLRATGNGDQRPPMGLKARKRTLLFMHERICVVYSCMCFVLVNQLHLFAVNIKEYHWLYYTDCPILCR